MGKVTLIDQIKEIERELAVRKRVYPRWILQGKIKQDIANHRINALESILETLNKMMSDGTKQMNLF